MTDQHITAIATIVQDGLLLASAVLIGWYLWETRKMRKAAESQVSKSQELVLLTQQQIAVSQALVEASQIQLEAQIRPAVVVRLHGVQLPQGIQLQNVGAGPAVNLLLAKVDHGAAANWQQRPNYSSTMQGSYLDDIDPERLYAVNSADFRRAALQITYESLSGKTYATVVDFDENSKPTQTRFHVRP